MLLILEGPDGAGKTTLANEIAAHLGRTTSDKIEVLHAKRPEHHPLNEYLRPLRTYRPRSGHHIILDRWHWGEHVYPRVLGRETQLGEPEWWAIEAYLRRLGAVVVHCERALRDDYLRTYRERGVDSSSPDTWQFDQLDRIRIEFQRTVYRSQLDAWPHRAGDPIEGILTAARHREECTRPLNDFTTYLGPLKPAVLLLGDVRNVTARTNNPDPAFVPFRGTSGYYLLRALTSLTSRSLRHAVGLANACDVDDPVQLWKTLGEPPVVALGKNAYGKLLTSGVTCGVVPHPQFVRRFHHKMHVEYGWLIYQTSRTGEDNSKWPQSSAETTDATSTPTFSLRSDSSDTLDPAATAQPAT